MKLPAPFIPADVDLSGMPHFPLQVERLRRSRAMQLAAADPPAGFSMLLLWGESWSGTPAGSLENDDLLLAAMVRCPIDQWEQRRRVALYGWVLCSDGRLYHRVICALAWSVWQARLKHRWKNACDRDAKANKRARAENRLDDIKTILKFEPWVRAEYPATAAKLFAAADDSAPAEIAAPVVHPADGVEAAAAPRSAAPCAPQTGPAPAQAPSSVENVDQKGGRFEKKSPPFSATAPPCRSELPLKRKDKDKIPPHTPPWPARSDGQEGPEWAREADFAAFLAAVGQPDAPVRSCWTAWVAAVPDLPPLRLLLAEVAAWRAHHARKERELGRYIRPLGPARLLREGTLANFREAAERMLADEAKAAVIEHAEADRAARARQAWGDLVPVLTAVAGGEAPFLAWFADGWPEWEGEKLVICMPRAFAANWIRSRFAPLIDARLKREVEVRQVFLEREKA